MDTRDIIYNCTLTLFLQGGYEALSMRKIAACSGISATAIYRHYPDKHSLLNELIRQGFQVFYHRLKSAPDSKSATIRLKNAARAYTSFAVEDSSYYRLIFMSDDVTGFIKLPVEEQGQAAQSFSSLEAICYDFLKSKNQPVKSASAMAIAVWGQLHGLCSLYLINRISAEQLPALVDQSVGQLLKGWTG